MYERISLTEWKERGRKEGQKKESQGRRVGER